MKRTYIVVDIEGTILEKIGGEPNKAVIDLMKLYKKAGYFIIIATGQEPSQKSLILKEFKKYGVPYDVILMKPEDDDRKTRDWKEFAIQKYLKDCNQKLSDISVVLENHGKSCKMWDRIGVQALLVHGFEDV